MLNTKKKAIIIFIALLVLAISLVGAGTLAYTTREGRTDNEITVGNLKTALINLGPDGQNMPTEVITGILPATTYDNTVYVKNNGEHDQWVRVKVIKFIKDRDGTELPSDCVFPNYDEESWTYKDGYFYYKYILEPGQKSLPLYTQLYFDKGIGNAYKFATLTMDFDLDAVQSENNGMTVMDAIGWDFEKDTGGEE